MWRERISNFIYSYGLIFLGGLFLLIGSVSFASPNTFAAKMPVAEFRLAAVGGDMAVMNFPVSRPVIPLPKDHSVFEGELTAISALVVDDKTDKILFSKNSEEVRPLASITKLMSALVLSDLPMQWSTSTVVQNCDCDESSHQISAGEKFTLDDLWNIALVASSNSSINVLVRATGLEKENFVALMNRKAKDLKMDSAVFVEPTGLDAGNKANAADTLKLLKEALLYHKIISSANTAEYYAQPLNKQKVRRVYSTNLLLTNWVPNNFDKDTIVGKTGYIIDSGYNFTVRLEDKERHVVRIVVMGAATSEARFSEARDLAEWVFSHYSWPDQAGYDLLVE